MFTNPYENVPLLHNTEGRGGSRCILFTDFSHSYSVNTLLRCLFNTIIIWRHLRIIGFTYTTLYDFVWKEYRTTIWTTEAMMEHLQAKLIKGSVLWMQNIHLWRIYYVSFDQCLCFSMMVSKIHWSCRNAWQILFFLCFSSSRKIIWHL